MKSMFSVAVVIAMLTVWDSTMGSESGHETRAVTNDTGGTVRCDQLAIESIKYLDLIRVSPFTMTHTISPIYSCSKAVFIRSVSSGVDMQNVVIKGNSVIYYDVNIAECKTIGKLTDCVTAIDMKWQMYRVRLRSQTDGFFCSYICSSDGYSLKHFNCLAAGNSFNPEIDEVLKYIKSRVPGADAIVDARANCPAPKCTLFP